jgi:hypothetical protein
MKEASARGILVEEACTLVMLASGVYWINTFFFTWIKPSKYDTVRGPNKI